MANRKAQTDSLVCHQLTLDRWDDFETLFGPRGACGGCWCMTWRLKRSEFVSNKGEGNRKSMLELVRSGEEPGLLGYLNGEPVGWVAVAPREQYSALGRSRVLKPVDDKPVWSVSCLFVRKSERRQGISVQLLQAAIEYVRKREGTIVEGYPIESKMENLPGPFAWTGLVSAFLQAGFHECHRHSPIRPIMRFEIA